MMTRAQFHNALRILLNIDEEEMPELSPKQKTEFFTDPFKFFIRADDKTAHEIWRIIERRSRRGAE